MSYQIKPRWLRRSRPWPPANDWRERVRRYSGKVRHGSEAAMTDDVIELQKRLSLAQAEITRLQAELGALASCLPTTSPADCCGGADCLDCHCSDGGALPFDCEPRRE